MTRAVGKGERVAIIGSREGVDADCVREYVRALPAGTVVISGGARGVDSVAATEAKKMGLEVREWLPDYEKFGRLAPLCRNQNIVDDSDRVVAFWNGGSRGTKNAIDLAQKAGKPWEIHNPDGHVTRSVRRMCSCGGLFGCEIHDELDS